MALNYQELIDQAVFKKLNKLTINEIRIVINQLQLKYKRGYSNPFYAKFVTNVRENNDDRVRSLYINDLNQNFSNDVIDQLKPLAKRHQTNQLNQTIRKQVNQTFNEDFKQRYQDLILEIANETLQNTPF